ncbi:MAG TPA: helix-turn-helix transcriptional regulator, partial [Acidimicrobiales bacterium]|nr:helix-turn-helix transcriptional regulator [Acidimicrobiales bacterium]
HAMAGQASEAEAVAAEAARLAPEQPDVAAGIPGRVRAWAELRSGDLAGAAAELDQAVAVLREHPALEFPFWGLWCLLRTSLDQDGASARAEAASAPGSAYAFNRCWVALARAVAAGRGGDEDATRLVEEAFELLHEGHGRAWGAVALAVVASSALREGWGQGPRWARQSLAAFEADGLEELASWCRSMLRDAGEPVPRRRGRAAPAGLRALGVTSREVDVLELLAAGVTNAEIARRLHLSHRTVERHVSNLLTKTSATDRRDLARLAHHAGVSAAAPN